MKKQQPADWQTSLSLLEERLPRIDVTDQVMDAVRRRSGTKLHKSRKWYISIAVAAVVFACGFGYAAESWKLFAPDGSVTLEYRSFLPGDEPRDELDTAKLHNMLAEGEAAIFHLMQEDRMIGLANERQYADYAQFASEVGSRAPLKELGDDFNFQSGKLVHDLKSELAEEIDWTDSKTVDDIRYRMIPLGNVTGYYASYSDNSGHKLSLSAVFNLPDRQIFTTEMNHSKVEKVQVGATEIFYMKDTDSTRQRVAWGEGEGERYVYYRLDDLSTHKLPRENLIEMASAVMGK
ncbi:hypothetical protein [Paenibacillus sp. NPDC058071]|uniref:hypothetical protein n=1 Tax=Paenibacillus sp. NPDC058071 TaxID=3346326 RepID=UPI0036DEFA19